MPNVDEAMAHTDTAVRAALDEVTIAVMFHETWKPTAYDADLHARMGNSHATHAFQIIRASLRREMLLALMRVWDSNKQALRMSKIVENLHDKSFFDALFQKRIAEVKDFPMNVRLATEKRLKSQRQAILTLGRKYQKSGSGFGTFAKLRILRDQRLAHRQISGPTTPEFDATDDEIERFYADTLDIVTRLVALVLGAACDLEGAGGLYRHHAASFWVNARGERTEGHPTYQQKTP